MEDKTYHKVQKRRITGIFPVFLIGAFFLILLVMVFHVTAKDSGQSTSNSLQTSGNEPVSSKETSSDKVIDVLAVLKDINKEEESITLLDTQSGQDIIVNYTGGTQLFNKYEKVLSIAQLSPGIMVDAYYNGKTLKLIKLQISDKAWEYKGVINWSIYVNEQRIDIVNSKFRYSDKTVITREGNFLEPKDLDEKDELIVRGYDRFIWSIEVVKGHGILIFKNYEDFIGGTAYIGKNEVLPVTEDMSVVVREGTYDITLEKGDLKGTKTLTVIPEESFIVDMIKFKKPQAQTGKINFNITPYGADLKIDNKETEYEDAVELEYGEHKIEVSLGGYITYSGILKLKEAEKMVNITLAETKKGTTEEGDKTDSSNTVSDKLSDVGSENSKTNEDNKDYEQVISKNYIYVQEPEGASVYFNGQFKGTSPVSFPKEVGTHYITLIQSGYSTKTYTVEVKDDKEDVKLSFPAMIKTE